MPFEQWIGLAISDEDLYRKYREGMTPILERYGGSFRYDLVIASVLKAEVEQPIDRVFAILRVGFMPCTGAAMWRGARRLPAADPVERL